MVGLGFASLLPNNDSRWPDLLAVARAMDEGRWEAAFTYDQFLPPLAHFPGIDAGGPCFEGWTLCAALAAQTERVKLGVLVSGNTYRNPALVAKMAATVDHISAGRLILGIGAAWSEPEHRAYGWDFPSQRERNDRLDEACEVLHRLFAAEQPVTFEGQYYRLEDAPFSPKPVQLPHPPILVGGGGEKRTLRTVARYGDIMNVRGTQAQVAHKIRVLEAHCASEGRDPATIRKSVVTPVVLHDDLAVAAAFRERHAIDRGLSDAEALESLPIGDAAHVRGVLERYAEVGVDLVIFTGLPNRPALYERLESEVIAPFAAAPA